MAPSFFALLEGNHSTGATLHIVDEGIDTGPILTQITLPIEKNDTVYTLNKKSSESGGAMLARFLENVNLEKLESSPQPEGNLKYYTYPTKGEIAQFRKKGLLFDRF
jgi:methionyl-tRNA formyltransferase